MDAIEDNEITSVPAEKMENYLYSAGDSEIPNLVKTLTKELIKQLNANGVEIKEGIKIANKNDYTVVSLEYEDNANSKNLNQREKEIYKTFVQKDNPSAIYSYIKLKSFDDKDFVYFSEMRFTGVRKYMKTYFIPAVKNNSKILKLSQDFIRKLDNDEYNIALGLQLDLKRQDISSRPVNRWVKNVTKRKM